MISLSLKATLNPRINLSTRSPAVWPPPTTASPVGFATLARSQRRIGPVAVVGVFIAVGVFTFVVGDASGGFSGGVVGMRAEARAVELNQKQHIVFDQNISDVPDVHIQRERSGTKRG